MSSYFTDREFGSQPRTIDTIDARIWGGLYSIVDTRIRDGSFGHRFPESCPDGHGQCGCDEQTFRRMLAAEVPKIEWPLSPETIPDTPAILDLLEFCSTAVGQPVEGSYHSFFRHHHLTWDREAGLGNFVVEVNRLLARNGVAFELSPDGFARRVLPQELAQMLGRVAASTGDVETDKLLAAARKKIALPKPDERQDALEKLWDAFERIKTLGEGGDKRKKSENLVSTIAGGKTKIHDVINIEMKSITEIGNNFRIRHSEVGKEIISQQSHVDYLFMRMFALVIIMVQAIKRTQ